MSGDERLSRLSAIKLALLAKQTRAESADISLLRAEPIAIVGMGCRFPRGESLDEFWQTLRDGIDAIGEVPSDRWSWKDFQDVDPSAPGKITSRWGGFISSVYDFDAPFFGISRREAAHLDPQQQVFLEVAHEALDDAGLVRAQLAGERVGVFVGSYHSDFALAQYASPDAIDAYSLTGTAHSILANRLSYLLDLRGPSVSVDTACSTSLVAVHLACESLRSGESNIALAGAVTLMLEPAVSIGLSKWRLLAEDGRCKTFDIRADGFVRGEGAGVIVLKRLGDALVNGDAIHGLIRGSAVNQDGRTSVLTAPNGLAQEAVVRAALTNGAVSPDQISYFETHGTGTALGDPIEVEALAEVIGERASDKRVVLGAVKTNIGHLEAAAGMAGMIKVLLAMRHEVIPANLHFTSLNPNIGSAADRFEIPTEPRPWPRNASPRIAGVSSFGFGGTNAHVVLEETPISTPGRTMPPLPADSSTAANMAGAPQVAAILAISAQTDKALEVLASRYSEQLRASPDLVADVCYSAALHRDHFDCRAALIGSGAKSLVEGLDAIARGEQPLNGGRGRRTPGERPRIAFIFSGQGPQWWGMGRELRATEAVFAEALADCDAALAPHMGCSLLAELDRSEATSRLNETEIAQPAIFGIQVALAALWKSWGIDADAIAGHSVGEIAAAHVAGALSLTDAARLVAHRGRIMQEATGFGQMASVDLTESEATKIALASHGALSVAAINGPRSCVLSGDGKVLASVLKDLTDRGIPHKLLPVNYAFHSSQMAPLEAKLIESIDRIMPSRSATPLFSTVTGGMIEGTSLDPSYWARNMRQTVRFAAAVEALLSSGIDTFIEVAPHPVLGASIAGLCEPSGLASTIVASLRRGRPESQTMRSALAAMYSIGASVRWEGLFPDGGSRVTLPPYPWQRTRQWLKPPSPTVERREAGHPLLGRRIISPALKGPLFESRISLTFPDFLRDHVVAGTVVFPGTAFIEMALSSAPAASDGEVLSVRSLFLHQPLRITEGQERIIQCMTAPTSDGFGFEILSAATMQADPAEWVQHATGSVVRIAAPEPTKLDLAAVRTRCTQAVSSEELYSWYAARGIQFGATFRGVYSVQRGNAEALAQIIPPSAVAAQRDYLVHPALLDSCLQVVLALIPRQEGDEQTLLLPQGYDSLTLLRSPVGRLWSHATLRPTTAAAASLIADVVVTDESGLAHVRIDGLRIARTSTAELKSGNDLAAVDAYLSEWRTNVDSPKATMPTGTWLVLADQTGVGALVSDRLRDGGAKVVVAVAAERFDHREERWALRASAPEDFVRLVREARPPAGWSGVVHCWNLDANVPVFASAVATEQAALIGMASSLHLAQALVRHDSTAPPVWFVSRGARMVSGQSVVAPVQALQWGFARSLEAEHPELRITRVDLDPTSAADPKADVEVIIRELRATGPVEPEVAWRDGARCVPRLVRMKRQRSALAAQGNDGVRLVAGSSRLIEGLTLQPLEDAAPGPDDIELDVEATGLNFRDVLNAIGMSPGAPIPLGGECAGGVRRVGVNVHHFAVGDRVMAFATGSFASRVVVDARRAIALPRGIDANVAAGIPIVFLTAMYALHTLGSIKSGERVLVHAGTGGVGMAAIQIALRAGAQVFATAGTPQKRQLLADLGVSHAMDSRTLDFAAEIDRITHGEGVHVVLNSLAGEFISKSLDVLADGGRFLEMGKRDIWSATDVARVRPDVAYHAFDLADVATRDPALIARLLTELSALLENGTLRPLPTSRWPIAEAVSAFRHMAQARHTGKIVIVHESAPAAFRAPRPDGTYLVTGGLGALGLATAQWMVARGARRVILVGRKAPDEHAAAMIASLREAGATVLVESLDVSKEGDVENLIRGIAESGVPLRGIVHAAGVLDDGVVMEQTWVRSLRVLSPKVGGALALARHARKEQLDFFVCYSSATGVFGSPGQSSYSAANAYLDAFCHALRSSGVPAMSVQWGAWRDGGMAAELSARNTFRIDAKGIRPMAADAALSVLELAMASGMAEVAIMSVDWNALAAQGDTTPLRALSRELVEVAPRKQENGVSVLTAVRALGDSRRRNFLVEHARASALRVLGLGDETLIEAGRPLRELGLDSLGAVELRNALSRSLECTLPATLAFDHPTLNALADYLERRLFPIEPKPVAALFSSEAEAISELSDDDAEALLMAELNTGGSGT